MSFRISFHGDVPRASDLRPTGIQQLNILRDLMKFQDLQEDIRRVFYNDGTIIECHSFRGHHEVSIYVPPLPPPPEVKEEEIPTYYLPRASFRKTGSNTIYLSAQSGEPYLGTLKFYNLRAWGTADHIWFLLNTRVPEPEGRLEYWLLDGTSLFYNKTAFWTRRNPNAEIECTGLPDGVTNFSTWQETSTYHMVVSYVSAPDELIKHYTSLDGRTWAYDSTVTYTVGVQALVGTAIPVSGGGWFNYGEDLFYIEDRFRDKEPGTYPPEFFRLYRIGQKVLWDLYGTRNTPSGGFTQIADATSLVAYTFEAENDFQLEGGSTGFQVLQVWDRG